MLKTLVKFQTIMAQRERGATAVEYALMVALIAIAIIATVRLMTTSLNGVFTDIKNALDGV